MAKNSKINGLLAKAGKLLSQGLLAATLICASGAVPVMAASLRLPPIVEPATSEHHTGKVVFRELVTPDVAAAKRFYGAMFGWSFRDIKTGRMSYAEALFDGGPVAGIMEQRLPAGERRRPAWLTFLSVKDVEAAKRSALTNGAKVLHEPHDLPDRGKQAVFADPQGAVFAVVDSGSGDPSDLLPSVGEWIWSSLGVPDPDKDAAFYQKLFDYEVFDLPAGPAGTEHFLLASDNFARASVNTLPQGKLHPHWLNYVRVNNADEMAARAVKLGGRVLVEPQVDRHGGRIAIVADPQGAVFGLMEWKAQGSEVVR